MWNCEFLLIRGGGRGRVDTPIAKWRQRYVRKMLNKRLMHNLFEVHKLRDRGSWGYGSDYNPFIANSRERAGEGERLQWTTASGLRITDNRRWTTGRYGHNVWLPFYMLLLKNVLTLRGRGNRSLRSSSGGSRRRQWAEGAAAEWWRSCERVDPKRNWPRVSELPGVCCGRRWSWEWQRGVRLNPFII